MSGRHALRIGAIGAIVGGILVLVGNILHPHESGQLDDAQSFVVVVADSGTWIGVHFLILIGLALLLGAYLGLCRSITREPGMTWARLSWGISIIGVGFGLALMLTEIVAISALADMWVSGSGTEKDLALAAASAVFQLSLTMGAGGALFLFGATPLFYGVAILKSDDYAPWLGWIGVTAGLVGVLAGVTQLFADTTIAQFVLFPIAAVATTLWIIYLGVMMWRKSVIVDDAR
jgi:hypothetical protein